MRRLAIVLLIAVLQAACCGHVCNTPCLQIFFDQPVDLADGLSDEEWESQTLPLGNGNLGINVCGGIGEELMTFNEKSLWTGGPAAAEKPEDYWDADKQSAWLLPEIRRALECGDTERADSLTRKNFNGKIDYQPSEGKPFLFGNYTTAGEFRIATGIDAAGVEDYRRVLNIADACAEVSFRKADVAYRREYFVSYPANAVVVRFSADRKGCQNLVFSYLPNPESTGGVHPDGSDALLWTGCLDNNGMEYAVRMRAIADGGSVDNGGGCLNIAGADAVTFIITADTDYAPNYNPDVHDAKAFVGVDPKATTRIWLDEASSDGYAKLRKVHTADYQNLFGRVELSLNPNRHLSDALPTPKRLQLYREGNEDFGLEELYFQYGRYLLISSSRPGNLPANLQGVWSRGVDAPWHADYHNNINLQMNYWPACPTNLAECTLPFIDFVRMLQPAGRRTAKAYYGSDGWTASISGNIFGFTAPLSSEDMSWNLCPVAGPWLATMVWDFYDFTRDKRYLDYHTIRSSAVFAADLLWENADGEYTVAPSTSPEHGPVDDGATFANAVVRGMLGIWRRAFNAYVTDEYGMSLLIYDGEMETKCKKLHKISPYRIGRYGQLQEWSRDIDDPEDHHRHVNHLYGLHPGDEISPLRTPELAEAARVVLEHRGDGATGWSMGWKLNQWARLHDGDRAYKLYGELLKNGTLDNLWDTHPPFQIDGNLGGTAGVAEMLLQSRAGFLHLLPALPKAWSDGSVKGLCARGGLVVDMEWHDGRLTSATIHSKTADDCCVLYDGRTTWLETKKGGSYTLKFN